MYYLLPRKLLGLIVLGVMMLHTSATASDAALEKRWAESLNNPQTQGKVLNIGTPPFSAILMEDISGKSSGVLLLLHDAGQHPDWPYLIRNLRLALPEHGWHTLSIQLPVQESSLSIDNYAKMLEESTPRIQSAIATLKEKKMKPVFIVGHGLGATIGAMYLSQHPKDAQGFVGIGMLSLPGMEGKLDSATYLQKISLPVLDVYGSSDQPNVMQGAKTRTIAARKGAGGKSEAKTDKEQVTYRQMEIQGADHDFTGLESMLAKRIRGWLIQQTTLIEGTK